MRALDLAGVDLDARRGVHGDDRDAVERRDHRRRVVAQAAVPPDADDPVDHHVGAGGLLHRADHPAADGEQRREARRVDPVGAQQQGLHLHATPGEQHPAVQRVTAVVARADQQQHAGAVRVAEQVEDGVPQPGGGPLHEGPLGQPCHEGGLRRPDLLDGVCAAHPANLPSPHPPRHRMDISDPWVTSRHRCRSKTHRCRHLTPQPQAYGGHVGAPRAPTAR